MPDIELIDRVVASILADPGRPVLDYAPRVGSWLDGPPKPVPAEILDTLAFPSGRPLSPALRRWLAFDTGLLTRFGWFTPGGHSLAPRPLGEIAAEEFGEPWGTIYRPTSARFGECFLLPGGSDSRRVLAVDQPDETGEYPVFVLDVDDLPCIELRYPGFDVYLADTAGLSPVKHDSRMRTHAHNCFGGRFSATFPEPPFNSEFDS